MSLVASFVRYPLHFTFTARTSRGSMTLRDTWLLRVHDKKNPEKIGWGECSPLIGLSIDDRPDFAKYLDKTCRHVEEYEMPQSEEEVNAMAYALLPSDFPSIRFGLQTALLDLMHGAERQIFPSDFSKKGKPIPINGLIWMDGKEAMMKQAEEKLAQGYTTIKLKVGALNLQDELDVLAYIRAIGGAKIVIRIDANGAFAPDQALAILEKFQQYSIHSVEQPIRKGQLKEMKEICAYSPISVALDEELIGCHGLENKRALLDATSPYALILKPSLLGGYRSCREWIQLAAERKMDWWLTSALESNIGLNAISQFAATFSNPLPQGLGTGQLYKNNFASPLEVKNGEITYLNSKNWDLRVLHA
ncbi:o-succinylbenzoate synthase [Cytophagales bacterium LB-30]|uniref:O-succinylbenzoate synthase n=1 Tax=Shiella aurantiaca TaxID=3058365 RepID=A0ABT8F1K2_9BACT|nr:o-succinylbenzoate synthase [Shiella aurantiaca]MDN4164332.1 o-succinylbenzoate synthase [Shiella aurantiaca]